MAETKEANTNAVSTRRSVGEVVKDKMVEVYKCLKRHEIKAQIDLHVACIDKSKPPDSAVGRWAGVIEARSAVKETDIKLKQEKLEASNGNKTLEDALVPKIKKLQEEHDNKLRDAIGKQDQNGIDRIQAEQAVFDEIREILR